MAATHIEKASGITNSIVRLHGIASASDDTNGATPVSLELSKSLEDCLYELTGILLDLFRLEDEHQEGDGAGFEQLLAARRTLSEELHRFFDVVVSARTCEQRTVGELREDIRSIAQHFQDYRSLSPHLDSHSASQ